MSGGPGWYRACGDSASLGAEGDRWKIQFPARLTRPIGRRHPERRGGPGLASDRVSQVKGTAFLDDDRVVEELVAPVQLREYGTPSPNSTGTRLTHTSSTRPRSSACWVIFALAMVTSWSPATCLASVIAASTPSTNVVLGHLLAASSGARWVTTTTGAPTGWLSPQPLAMSNRCRPETSAPVFPVNSRSISALASSTWNEILLIGGGHGNVPGPVPVEQFLDLIIRIRDEPIQRHRHVGEHLAHRGPPLIARCPRIDPL